MSQPLTRGGRPGGFTLIELLVVVSVIMLLMAMVLPALQGASAKAREVKCLSNVGQLAKAVVAYSANNDSFVPSPAHVDTLPPAATFVELNDPTYFDGERTLLETETPPLHWYRSYTWKGKLLPFLGARYITVSDELKAKGGTFERSENESDRYMVMRCPSVRDFRGHKSFYGMNGYVAMYTNPERLRDPDTEKGITKSTHFDDLLDTARTLLIGENNDGHWAVKPKEPRNATDFATLADCGFDATFQGQVYGGEAYGRHNRRICWTYFDGHTVSMNMTTLYENRCFQWLPDKEVP